MNGILTSTPGSNLSLSFISIPAIMQAPAPLAAKQWYTIFTRGGAFGIPSALISALACGYVATQRNFFPSFSSFPFLYTPYLSLP